MTNPQQFFTTVGVSYLQGEFVHFPPQTERSGICGQGNGRRRVRLKSKMGRVFSGTGESRSETGFHSAPFAIQLFPQDDFAGKFRSQVVSSICPFSDVSASMTGADEHRDHADTGLVTFGVYGYWEGGKTDVSSAKMTPQALQAGQAGTRVAYRDAQEIQALAEGRKAGCDAGKGARELAAGSLAWRRYAGTRGSGVFAAGLVCDGSERN